MAKVLVVEKDSVFAAVLEDRLRVAGHEVRLLRDIAQAPAVAGDQQSDLVLLDMGAASPVDAADAVHALRAQPDTRTVPVLVMSDGAEPADRVAALRAGADDYLTRPFDLEELLIRSERLLGGRGAEQMLQGDLATHPLWAVLQYLQQVRKTGSLKVRSGNTSGTVELRDGEPVAARWQALRGREAFLALLSAEEGSFRFEGGMSSFGSSGPSSQAEPLSAHELLMYAAWLKDELEKRRSFLPGAGEPLQNLTDFLPKVDDDFGDLPLERILTRIRRQPGLRMFDLIAEEAEAPLTTRLSLAWLVEHGLVSPRDKVPTSAPQNTMEISSAMVFDVAVATLLDAAKKAGLDTSALPCLVLVEPSAWPVLRRLIEEAPGFRTNEALRKLIEQVELRRAGSASFGGASGAGGKLSLYVQTLTPAAQPQIQAILSECAGVLVWIDGDEGAEMARTVVQKLDATGGPGSGMLVAGTAAAQKLAERLSTGSRRWRTSPHAPKSLLGLFRLLQPH